MGNETNTKLRAKAASIAIKPPLSLSLMLSNGAETPFGMLVDEAAGVLALDGEAMTNGY